MLRARVPPGGSALTAEVSCAGVRALLLDVEGTTTPITFVTRVLFPYAREHVRAFLEAHAHDAAVAADLRALAAERAAEEGPLAPPPWSSTIEAAVAYVHFLMDQRPQVPGPEVPSRTDVGRRATRRAC